MFFREAQSCKRIGFNGHARFDDETAFRFGYSLPNHGLTRAEVHVATEFSGNGHLPAFGNSGFHMTTISCNINATSLEAGEILQEP
jgi:hypothetical protein